MFIPDTEEDMGPGLPAGEVSPHESDAADMAQLMKEIKLTPDEAVKPSKWNMYENASRKQILKDEFDKRSGKLAFIPDDNATFIPDEEPVAQQTKFVPDNSTAKPIVKDPTNDLGEEHNPWFKGDPTPMITKWLKDTPDAMVKGGQAIVDDPSHAAYGFLGSIPSMVTSLFTVANAYTPKEFATRLLNGTWHPTDIAKTAEHYSEQVNNLFSDETARQEPTYQAGGVAGALLSGVLKGPAAVAKIATMLGIQDLGGTHAAWTAKHINPELGAGEKQVWDFLSFLAGKGTEIGQPAPKPPGLKLPPPAVPKPGPQGELFDASGKPIDGVIHQGHVAEIQKAIEEIKAAPPEQVMQATQHVTQTLPKDPTAPVTADAGQRMQQILQVRETLRLQQVMQQDAMLVNMQARDRQLHAGPERDEQLTAAEAQVERNKIQTNRLQEQPTQQPQANAMGGGGEPSMYVGEQSMTRQREMLQQLQDAGITAKKSYFKPGVIEFASEADRLKAQEMFPDKQATPSQLPQAKGDTPVDLTERIKRKQQNEDVARKARMDQKLSEMAPPHQYSAGENVRLRDGRRFSITSRTLNAEAAEPAYHGNLADPTTGMHAGHTLELDNGRPINETEVYGRYTGPERQRTPSQEPQSRDERGKPTGMINNKGGIFDVTFNAGKTEGLLANQRLLNINSKEYKGLDAKYKLFAPKSETPFLEFLNAAPLNGRDMVAAMREGHGRVADHYDVVIKQDRGYDITHEPGGGIVPISYLTETDVIKHPTNPFAQAYHWTAVRLRSALATEHQIAFDHFKPGNDAYNAYYKIKTLWRFMKDQFKEDTKLVVPMEGGKGWYVEGGEWIPTVQNLMDAGMKPESAQIWRTMHEGHEKLWNMLSQAMALVGRDMPPRVPGWLPHFITGSWRVIISDVAGNYTHEFGYYRRSEQRAAYKAMMEQIKERPDLKIETEDPGAISKQTADIVTGLLSKAKEMKDNPALHDFILDLAKSEMQGIVQQVMERQAVPKAGHLLERINMEGHAGIPDRQILVAAKMMERMQSQVIKFHQSLKFLHEDFFPMVESGVFPDGSNVSHAVDHLVKTYLEKNSKIGVDIEYVMKDFMRKFGLDPGILEPFGQFLKSAYGKFALSWKPGFWEVNYFQKTFVLPTLLNEQVKLGLAGASTMPNIASAFKAATSDLATSEGRSFRQRALLYAARHGFSDPRTLEQLDPGWGRDPVGVFEEKNTRKSTFLTSAKFYLDSGMTEEQAFRAAGTNSERVAVPTSPRVGQAIIITRLPQPIRSMALFYGFGSQMLAMAEQTRMLMFKSAYALEPKAAAKASASLGSILVLGYALGSVGGLIGSELWDAITEGMSKLGYYWPDSKAVARQNGVRAQKLLKSLGANDPLANLGQDVAQFGLLSGLIGYNVTPSAMAPTINMSLFGADTLKLMWETAMLSATYGVAKLTPKGMHSVYEPSPDDWNSLVHKMPPQWQTKINFFMRNDYKDIPKLWAGEMQNYTEGRRNGQRKVDAPGMEITPFEALLDFWTGLKSNRIAAVQEIDREMSEKELAAKNDVTEGMKLIASPQVSMDRKVEIIVRLRLEYYLEQDSMEAKMIEGMKNTVLTDEQAQLINASTSNEAQKWFLERQEMLDNRGRR